MLVGEWWNGNTQVVERTALSTGAAPNVSDAATINGYPGPLYKKSGRRKCYFILRLATVVQIHLQHPLSRLPSLPLHLTTLIVIVENAMQGNSATHEVFETSFVLKKALSLELFCSLGLILYRFRTSLLIA